MAISSAFELETLIILAGDLEMISDKRKDEFISSIQELEKMIYGFRDSLQ